MEHGFDLRADRRWHARVKPLVFVLLSAALTWSVVSAGRGVAANTSGTWDETIYLFLGRQLVVSQDWDSLASLGVAPLPLKMAWTGDALAPLDAPAYDAGVYRGRVMRARGNAVWRAGVPLVLAVFAWITVEHGLVAGFLAAALLAFSPNILAHASLATSDISFALSFVLSLVALTAFVRTQSWLSAGFVAIALGLSLATKYSALAIFLTAVILLLWQRRERTWSIDLLALAGALLVAWAAHDWATAPLVVEGGIVTQWVERLLGWTGESSRVSGWFTELRGPIYIRGIAAQLYLDRSGQEAFLLGQTSQRGWWYYFPVALALKSTPVELFAFVAFGVLAVVRRGRDAGTRVITTAAVVFGAAALGSHRDLGIRYVLPLVVIGIAGAVAWLTDALRPHPRAALGLAAVALVAQFASAVSIAPDYLAYFNSMSGGPSRGYTKLVDSNLDWGQDLPRLSAWLNARGTDRVILAHFGSAPPQAYGIRASSLRKPQGDAADSPAWFAISVTLLQGVFMCGDPFAPLRAIEPDGRVGYTMMAYATDRAEVRVALDAARADPCAP